MTAKSLRCLLVSDFTIDGLVPFLRTGDGTPRLECEVAPFGQAVSLLLDGDHPCWRTRPDVAIVWTRPQVVRAFASLLEGERVATGRVLEEVDELARALGSAAKRAGSLLVPTWTLPPEVRGQGPLALHPESGIAYHLLRMNARLAEAASAHPNVHVLDAGRWLATAGAAGTNPKLWLLGKIAFAPPVWKLAAADVKAAIRAVSGQARKLVVVDLDDTLWGGVVGDVGRENLQLGGHDPVGEAFAQVQRGLLALTRRGVVLAIASKNTEAVALDAIDQHPEMVLRREHFAAWRINWEDKAKNLLELAEELGLGLDSIVFLDDNPAERERVRQAFPEVLVPDWPSDPLLAPKALAELDAFDAIATSDEDRRRAELYASRRERRALERAAPSPEEYLASLGLEVRPERLGPSNLARAAQLLNKTNQMNLRTRRLSEAALAGWSREPGHHAFAFRVADRFDDHGLTGLASFHVAGRTAVVDDFVISCRVLGRGVERAVLGVLVEAARGLELEGLVAEHVPTPRNAPCRSFFEETSGLSREGESRFVWSLGTTYPGPSHVKTLALGSEA